jgi:hypothetical protein
VQLRQAGQTHHVGQVPWHHAGQVPCGKYHAGQVPCGKLDKILIWGYEQNFSFDPSNACFCNSNMHKGFKCLDVSEGHVYTYRDVVFDEIVFPFAQLHPDAGARLRSEILLLPSTLLNPSSDIGDNNSSGPFGTNSLPTN